MKRSVTHRWLDANTLLIRAAGLVALLSVPFERLPQRVEGVLPLHLARTSHLLSLFLGLALLYIASQLALRKLNSWYLAVGALTVLLVAELLHFRNPLQLALYAVSLAVLFRNRKEFVVKSDVVSVRRGVLLAAGMFLAVVLFVVTVFTIINVRAFGRELTFSETLSVTVHQVFANQEAPADVRLHRYDRALIELLRLAAVAMVAIILGSLFRPLKLRWGPPASHRLYARQLLERYSTSPEDYFKLWPEDKHYYFYRESFVAYTLANGIALVLDGASGYPQDVAELRQNFLQYAQLNGWQVAVIHADAAEAAAWQAAGVGGHESSGGMKQVFIGSEAFVETEVFTRKVMGSKHFRYVRNRAAKDGLHHEVWQPPLNDWQLTQLQAVSEAWSQEGGRREYTYMMGYYDRSYLRDCRVVVLQNADGIVAYANIIPAFAQGMASVDHIRAIPGTSSVAMHFLLMETIRYAAGQGAAVFNLGLAPLSKLNEKADKNLNERLLILVRQLGGAYYSFAGLEQFKGKFVPSWSPRYIVYQSNTYLLNVAAALSSVVAYEAPGQRDTWRPWLIGLAAFASLSYASFVLAVWLNPSHFLAGLVSFLGQSDQPYSWVFNELDVVSSTVSAFVLLAIPALYQVRSRLLRWAIGLAAASSLGNLLAAITPLPDAFEGLSVRQIIRAGDVQVFGHGLASFMNSAGFVVAAVLWAWAWRRQRGAVWRAAMALSILLLSTVGDMIGDWYPWSAPLLQRVFIVLYGVWLVVFVVDVTRRRKSSGSNKA